MTLQISTFLTVPDYTAGRSAFVAAANQFGYDTTPFANEANAMAVEMSNNALAAASAKGDAEAARDDAEAARDAAINASMSVASTYDPDSYVYSENDLVWDGPDALYRCILGYTSTATTPANDPTHWALTNIQPSVVTQLQIDADALRDLPPNVKTGAYTLQITDRGKSIDTSANVTIPTNASVAFPVGAVVVVTNRSSSVINITPAAGVTLRLAGTTQTGTLKLAGYGVATLRKVAANEWYAIGVGLSK